MLCFKISLKLQSTATSAVITIRERLEDQSARYCTGVRFHIVSMPFSLWSMQYCHKDLDLVKQVYFALPAQSLPPSLAKVLSSHM